VWIGIVQISKGLMMGLDFSEVFDSEFTEEKEQEQKRAYEAAVVAIEENKGQEF